MELKPLVADSWLSGYLKQFGTWATICSDHYFTRLFAIIGEGFGQGSFGSTVGIHLCCIEL